MTAELNEVKIMVSEDGHVWKPCQVVGEYCLCGACEVGLVDARSEKCPNCLAAVKVGA